MHGLTRNHATAAFEKSEEEEAEEEEEGGY
jgi:hypothetical protein